MKNIFKIVRHDLKHITGSVVAIITIMGLCIIPCLYAWFNIFSNWAPYESEATGRIPVAVVSEDTGTVKMGFSINVGEKIVDALKANDDIGWIFLDTSDEAIEGVYAGDYYAALVIPEDFSKNALSFIDGDFENPKLLYYENEKKNAIAPKITGKAKTAVQEQVNATFVQTLAQYLSEAASVAEASGLDPQKMFSDISDQIDQMSLLLDDCIVMLDSAAGLTNASRTLLEASDDMIEDAQLAVGSENDLIGSAASGVPDSVDASKTISTAVDKEIKLMNEGLDDVQSAIDNASVDLEAYNKFISEEHEKHKLKIKALEESATATSSYLTALGYNKLGDDFSKLSDDISDLYARIEKLETAEEGAEDAATAEMTKISDDITSIKKKLASIDTDVGEGKIDNKLNSAIRNAQSAVATARKVLTDLNDDLGHVSDLLSGYDKSFASLKGSIDKTKSSIKSMQQDMGEVSDLLDALSGNAALDDINEILANDKDAVAEYLASPVKMDTEVLYHIDEYGSAMAPFYTVLAQWVGALLTAVLIKVRLRKKDEFEGIRIHEHFFGRYGLFLLVGLSQALIVSLGDLIYVRIQCVHPVLFVLAACVNSIVFMLINYALVFALDNIGLGAGVIILVLQVAGSGGTYPVEVLPKVFRVLYPAMPFRYAMDAMRECIGGMYDGTYLRCIGILAVFGMIAILLGLLLYRPALILNRLIAESKQKSEIML